MIQFRKIIQIIHFLDQNLLKYFQNVKNGPIVTSKQLYAKLKVTLK